MPKGKYTLADIAPDSPPPAGTYTAADVDTAPANSTPPAPKPEGFLHSLGAQFGITPEAAQQQEQEFKAHPIVESLKALGGPAIPAIQGAYQGVRRIGGELTEAGKNAVSGNGAGVAYHAMKAIPIVGPAMDKAADQYADKDYAGEMGTITGAAAQAAPAVAGAVAKPMNYVANAGKMGADRFMQTTYPQNLSLTPEENGAQGFVKAIVPPVKAVNRITSAAPEIPTALDYAQRSRIPINGKLDFAKAAEGAAKELQANYDDVLLGPNKSVSINPPQNYNGQRFGSGETRGQATLGQINDRVNAINKELKSNYRQALDSQTGPVNSSDAALNAEKRGLTDILHNKLGELNGVAPEEIAGVRQRAGKLRTLAEETRLSANTDTVGEGRADSGTNGISRMGHAVIEKVGGGKEIVGNRIFKNALGNFQPKNIPLLQPNPPAPSPLIPRNPLWQSIEAQKPPVMQPIPDPAAVAEGANRFQNRVSGNNYKASVNRDAALQEFLHANNLEQAAQDAASQRSDLAKAIRDANAADSYQYRTGRKSPLYPPKKR